MQIPKTGMPVFSRAGRVVGHGVNQTGAALLVRILPRVALPDTSAGKRLDSSVIITREGIVGCVLTCI
jgi:hypothetical protein